MPKHGSLYYVFITLFHILSRDDSTDAHSVSHVSRGNLTVLEEVHISRGIGHILQGKFGLFCIHGHHLHMPH
jgi:hypothetical protein